MADLISRAAAIEAIKPLLYSGNCVSTLINMPAVDAVPVVHGRWKAILNPFWDAECSECGYAKKTGWEWGFCPNCGAKMDSERRDES